MHINDNCFYETKRKEEEIKYIMNWCFKFLEKKLGESGACVSNTTQQFYDYYFGEICAEKGVELREYYKPTFTKNSKLPTRSFKKEYLKTLFRSEKFYQDTLLAFKEYFYVSQMKFIQERIEKIFFMLRTFLLKSSADQESVEIKIARFLNKTNLQLPWNICQIANALRTGIEVLQNIKEILGGHLIQK